jgi:hypothetical protein
LVPESKTGWDASRKDFRRVPAERMTVKAMQWAAGATYE